MAQTAPTGPLQRKLKKAIEPQADSPEVLDALRECIGEFQTLEQFESNKNVVSERVLDLLREGRENTSEDCISLVNSGLRER